MFDQKEYKGWEIRFDPPPIPVRDFDWVAIHPQYEGWQEDGRYVSNGMIVNAPNYDALITEIDDWEYDNA